MDNENKEATVCFGLMLVVSVGVGTTIAFALLGQTWCAGIIAAPTVFLLMCWIFWLRTL